MQGRRKEHRDEEEEVLRGSGERGSHPNSLSSVLPCTTHRAGWGLQDFLLAFSGHLFLSTRLGRE